MLELMDIEFPPRIAFGAQVNPEWSTEVIVLASGVDQADQKWADVKHTYDISYAIRTSTAYRTVRDHFMMARGRARAFPFKDPLDFKDDGQGIALSTGVANTYQMMKRYGDVPYHYDRKITRPVDGSVTFIRVRSGAPSVITPTLDPERGTFVVTGHAGGDTYRWAGEFRVPCRYGTDKLPAAIPNKKSGPDADYWVDVSSIPIEEVRDGDEDEES